MCRRSRAGVYPFGRPRGRLWHPPQVRLLGDFELSVSSRACHLFTLLGLAGVGKSRLVRTGPRCERTDYPHAAPLDDLTGQVALVTGGGRGIGAGIARELASAGARVAVAARTREQIEQVAHEIEGVAIEVDVTDAAAVERMVNETESKLGPIDILVANAGTGNGSAVWDGEPDEWRRTFEVNVLGVYHATRHRPRDRRVDSEGNDERTAAARLPER